MRGLVTTFLACLLFACPFVCGADESGHDACCEPISGESSKGHAPEQCPDGGDSCVCRGAVQASDVRVVDAGAIAPEFLHILPTQPCISPPTRHLTPDGSPTGLASWGDSLTVRAYLQNFRF